MAIRDSRPSVSGQQLVREDTDAKYKLLLNEGDGVYDIGLMGTEWRQNDSFDIRVARKGRASAPWAR